MTRAVIGVSKELHSGLKELSREAGIPLTKILEHWLENCSGQNWQTIKKDYDNNKPSWKNIRETVKGYAEKYPDASDEELVQMSGFSKRQVETVTLSAHKRCIAYIRANPTCNIDIVEKECDVSKRFATRIMKQFTGDAPKPKSEEHLWQ